MPNSVEEFLSRLSESGLLSDGEIAGIDDSLELQGVVDSLIKQGKISSYQADVLSTGKDSPLVLGDYVILEKIGEGGMGQVFKARHRRMKRDVALKILPSELTNNEDAIKRFQREVEAAAKLLHPNIVSAFDAGEDSDTHYLITEYVEGTDLSALVKQGGPLSVEDAVDYIRQAATGLAYAHAKGVIHRDIKPSNILLDSEGVVKILDMGLARFETAAGGEEEATQAELTGTGTIMGTVDYMAPEQALDTKHADASCDVYSLGCTLHYLLTGQPVYGGDSLMHRLVAHREQPIPPLTDVSPELDPVFQRMVAKKAEDRFQSMGEVVDALQECFPADSSTGGARGSISQTTNFTSSGNKSQPSTLLKTEKQVVTDETLVGKASDATQPSVAGTTTQHRLVKWRTWKAIALIVVAIPVVLAVIYLNRPQEKEHVPKDPPVVLTKPAVSPQPKVSRTPLPDGPPGEVRTIEIPSGCRSLSVAPNGRHIAIATQEDKVHLYDLTSSQKVWELGTSSQLAGSHIRSVAFAPDGRTLVAIGCSNQEDNVLAWILQAEDGSTIRTLSGNERLALYSAFTEDGRLLATGTEGGSVIVWDARNGKRLQTLSGDDSPVSHLDFSPDSRILAAGSLAKNGKSTGVKLWDTATGKELPGFNGIGLTVSYLDVDFSPDGRQLLIGTTNEAAVIGDMETRRKAVRIYNPQRSGCYSVEFLPTGQHVLVGGTTLLLADAKTGEIIQEFGPPDSALISLAVTPDGRFAITGSQQSNTIRIWRLPKEVWPKETAVTDDPDRTAAEWVLGIGGTIETDKREFKAISELPKEGFKVVRIDLRGTKRLTDEDLERFKNLAHLTNLLLFDTPVSGTGFKHLKGLTTLTGLRLTSTQVEDESLFHLNGLTQLNYLFLENTKVSDDGLKHLKRLTNLRKLGLDNTKVTAQGIADLHKALPKCTIIYTEGGKQKTVGPKDK